MLIRGDARQLPLRDASVDCCITSPPYFGLRDYGDADQIGLEKSPAEYVAALVRVFADVRRVLKPSGTCWLNLGDSYGVPSGGGYGPASTLAGFTNPNTKGRQMYASRVRVGSDVKPKDMNGIPWRVALALQADGWYLRSDIIWHKPNPMPESVQDRPTKAHEYLFLLSQRERYYYDAEAIHEVTGRPDLIGKRNGHWGNPDKGGRAISIGRVASGNEGAHAQMTGFTHRNKRSVWTIPTMPYSGAHFATMPEKLVEPCILAGCPLGGLVLDPFVGSGTVVAVAERLGRRAVGVDLSYQDLAKERTAQRGLNWGASA